MISEKMKLTNQRLGKLVVMHTVTKRKKVT